MVTVRPTLTESRNLLTCDDSTSSVRTKTDGSCDGKSAFIFKRFPDGSLRDPGACPMGPVGPFFKNKDK